MPSVFPENMERGVSISSLYNFAPPNITTGLTDTIKYAYRKETLCVKSLDNITDIQRMNEILIASKCHYETI